MKIQVKSIKDAIDEATIDYLKERLENLDKYSFDGATAAVIVKKEKYLHTVEISLHTRHWYLFVHHAADDLRNAIDMAVDKLKRQLIKYHQKMNRRKTSRRTGEENED